MHNKYLRGFHIRIVVSCSLFHVHVDSEIGPSFGWALCVCVVCVCVCVRVWPSFGWTLCVCACVWSVYKMPGDQLLIKRTSGYIYRATTQAFWITKNPSPTTCTSSTTLPPCTTLLAVVVACFSRALTSWWNPQQNCLMWQWVRQSANTSKYRSLEANVLKATKSELTIAR